MRRTSSGASGGRPTRRDFHAQNQAKPRRCHAMTVAGRTIASASDHRDHRRQTTTQNARSMGRSRGRGVARRRIASCWRSTRFSATRLARGRRAASKAPTTASSSASIRGGSRWRLVPVTGESLPPARYAGPPAPAPHGKNPRKMSFSSPQANDRRGQLLADLFSGSPAGRAALVLLAVGPCRLLRPRPAPASAGVVSLFGRVVRLDRDGKILAWTRLTRTSRAWSGGLETRFPIQDWLLRMCQK